MSGSLRDELASLKIDRGARDSRRPRERSPRDRGEGGLRLLALLLWLIPLGLVAFAGVYAYQQYEKIRAKPEVSIGLVQVMTTGEAEKLLSAKGYLKSRYQAMIGTKIPGRVERMFVEEGARVKKGQVLAVLEHNELKANLASRKAMVARTEAEIVEARVDLKLKEREAARALRLTSQRSVSVEEAERAEAARGMAEARLQGLEASLRLQKANVEEAEETIRNMSLYAPFDGTVVQKEGEEGEIITPSAFSASTGRASVVTLASLEQMEVETDVAENLLSRIKLGQPAEVSVSAVPDRRYRGRLRQIIPMGDRSRGTVKVNVEILDPDENLFPELVATVHFLPDKAIDNPNANKALLFVPKAAVFEESGHNYVWVVGPRSKVTRKKVEVAPTNDDLARVESGLASGETVVLNPPKTLRENEAVSIAQ